MKSLKTGAVVLFLCGLGCGQLLGQGPTDSFLATLAESGPDDAIGRRGLAELFLDVARTLQRDRPGVEATQRLVRVPEVVRERVVRRLASLFEEYGRNLDALRGSASELVTEPYSLLALYRTLGDGQRTCWSLDLFSQQVLSWGAGGAEMRAMQPSREACGKFRTAAFHPAVATIVEEALVEQVYQREEIRRLREDLLELQGLLDDLAELDEPTEIEGSD